MDFEPPEQGTFAFCLDNRRAHFFPKYVQIGIRSSSTPEDTLEFSADVVKDLKASDGIPELENTLGILQVHIYVCYRHCIHHMLTARLHCSASTRASITSARSKTATATAWRCTAK